MADENTLKIEIEDATRENPLLDEFFKGGASPPPLPAGGPHAAAAAPPKGGPNFPATVLGPDGKVYSWDAVQAAQKKFQGQQQAADARRAYDAFHGPPDTARGADGTRYQSTREYFDARDAGEKGGGGGFAEDLLGKLGLGRFAKAAGAFGGGAGSAGAAGAAEAGGAGALGGAAAAGGIAAAALLAIDSTTKAFQGVKVAADSVAEAMQGIAENDLSGLQEGIHKTSVAFANSIPLVGGMVAAQMEAVHAIATLPEKITAAFIQRAHEIGGYSPEIRYAEAKSKASTQLADLREADTLGPDMARMIDAETELKLEIRELLLPIKKFLVEFLADRLELIVKVVRTIENFPTIWEKLVDTLGQVIVFTLNGDADERERALKILREEIKSLLKNKDRNGRDLYDQFFANLGGVPAA